MNEFNKIFAGLAYRHSFMNVFDDFLTLTICAFGLGRYEAEYLETIKRYDKKEINLFPQLLSALVMYYTDHSTGGGWVDGLGEFFEEHNGKFGRDARGQFFTPPQLCDLMAMITNPTNGSINDPAAGSGRCLIAVDRLNPNNRLQNFYVAQDVDNRCVKMCVVNMVLYGMKGAVLHMNTISLEVFGGYRVYLPDVGLGVVKLSKNECWQYITTTQTEEKKNEVHKNIIQQPESLIKQGTAKQLELFKILTS